MRWGPARWRHGACLRYSRIVLEKAITSGQKTSASRVNTEWAAELSTKIQTSFHRGTDQKRERTQQRERSVTNRSHGRITEWPSKWKKYYTPGSYLPYGWCRRWRLFENTFTHMQIIVVESDLILASCYVATSLWRAGCLHTKRNGFVGA